MKFPQPYKDNADTSTGLLFVKVYNKWHSIVKNELKQIGITHPQFVVMTILSYLNQQDAFVTQVKIAQTAEMDVMTVSKLLRGLETHGFIRRFPNPNDTRANAVQLLEKGEDAIQKAFPVVVGIDASFFGSLKEEETLFRDFLQTLL